MTLRIVLDTNVVVSALLKAGGLESHVLHLGLSGVIDLCTSADIVAEYTLVLARPRLKLEPEEVRITLEQLRKVSELMRPSHTLAVCSHEPDNRFLECAEAAQADFLVTGNKRHFPLKWKTTKIVNARELIEYFAAQQSR
jgi:putative PIN family toxin of toxin-antitoxin system